MAGEMTVVSIMHKVRVCARHLCKLRSVNGWWREINENAHLRAESSAAERTLKKNPDGQNQRQLDPFRLQTIFMCPDAHCLRREGQLIRKANETKGGEKKHGRVKLCSISKQETFLSDGQQRKCLEVKSESLFKRPEKTR